MFCSLPPSAVLVLRVVFPLLLGGGLAAVLRFPPPHAPCGREPCASKGRKLVIGRLWCAPPLFCAVWQQALRLPVAAVAALRPAVGCRSGGIIVTLPLACIVGAVGGLALLFGISGGAVLCLLGSVTACAALPCAALVGAGRAAVLLRPPSLRVVAAGRTGVRAAWCQSSTLLSSPSRCIAS